MSETDYKSLALFLRNLFEMLDLDLVGLLFSYDSHDRTHEETLFLRHFRVR